MTNFLHTIGNYSLRARKAYERSRGSNMPASAALSWARNLQQALDHEIDGSTDWTFDIGGVTVEVVATPDQDYQYFHDDTDNDECQKHQHSCFDAKIDGEPWSSLCGICEGDGDADDRDYGLSTAYDVACEAVSARDESRAAETAAWTVAMAG